MINLIALDLDGTLLNDQKEIMPITKNILIQLQKEGISIIPSSGRDITSIQSICKDLQIDKYIQSGYICLNGLEIYDYQGNILYQEKCLTYQDSEYLASLAQKLQLEMILFFCDDMFIIDNNNTNIIGSHFTVLPNNKINSVKEIPQDYFNNLRKIVFVQTPEYIENIFIDLKNNGYNYDICKVEPDWVEVNPKGIDKGTALKKLIQLKNIDIKSCMAFGNGENDIAMLKSAGIAVAMNNSFDSVKSIADDICEDCNHDGIGKYLHQYLKKEI